MNLRDFQKLFAKAVLPGKAEEAEIQLAAVLEPGGRLNLHTSLRVYARGYIARLTEALGETFEAVWWVLGDRLFFEVCSRYMDSVPSTSYDIANFGRNFPEFLAAHPREEAPFLADLAKYEWAFHEVFHSAPSTHFDHDLLHILHQRSDVKIEFQKHLRLFSAPYSVYRIWTKRGEDAGAAGELDWDRPEHLFLFKRDQAIFVQKIEPALFRVFELLLEGSDLEQAITRTAILFGNLTEAQVSGFFGDLIKAGVIAGIK